MWVSGLVQDCLEKELEAGSNGGSGGEGGAVTKSCAQVGQFPAASSQYKQNQNTHISFDPTLNYKNVISDPVISLLACPIILTITGWPITTIHRQSVISVFPLLHKFSTSAMIQFSAVLFIWSKPIHPSTATWITQNINRQTHRRAFDLIWLWYEENNTHKISAEGWTCVYRTRVTIM